MTSTRQIYNCDETFVPLDCFREKAITLKNSKHVYMRAPGTSEHITMLCAASAAGLPLPPIIYSKCFPGGQYRFEGPDDALYAKSESGWIDSELLLCWLKKLFLSIFYHKGQFCCSLMVTNPILLWMLLICVEKMTTPYTNAFIHNSCAATPVFVFKGSLFQNCPFVG